MKKKKRKCEIKKCGKMHDRNSRFCSQRCWQRNDFQANPKKWMLNSCRQNATDYGFECTLTIDDIPDIPERCPVLPWIKLVRPTGKGRGYYQDAPTIDRKDPKNGYHPNNIEIISFRANRLKCDGTLEEMKLIVKHLEKLKAEGYDV